LSWGVGTLPVVLGLIGIACLAFSRSALVAGEPERPALGVAGLCSWGVGMAAGIVVPLAALVLVTHIDFPFILDYNLRNAARAEANRPYEIWLLYGPLDFVQFLGLPLALASIFALIVKPWQPWQGRLMTSRSGERTWMGQEAASPRWYARVNVYAVVLLLTVAGLDLAGKSKAEQGRLLIFLMPLALLSFYLWAGRGRPRASVISQLFFAQMLVCVVIGARWFVP